MGNCCSEPGTTATGSGLYREEASTSQPGTRNGPSVFDSCSNENSFPRPAQLVEEDENEKSHSSATAYGSSFLGALPEDPQEGGREEVSVPPDVGGNPRGENQRISKQNHRIEENNDCTKKRNNHITHLAPGLLQTPDATPNGSYSVSPMGSTPSGDTRKSVELLLGTPSGHSHNRAPSPPPNSVDSEYVYYTFERGARSSESFGGGSSGISSSHQNPLGDSQFGGDGGGRLSKSHSATGSNVGSGRRNSSRRNSGSNWSSPNSRRSSALNTPKVSSTQAPSLATPNSRRGSSLLHISTSVHSVPLVALGQSSSSQAIQVQQQDHQPPPNQPPPQPSTLASEASFVSLPSTAGDTDAKEPSPNWWKNFFHTPELPPDGDPGSPRQFGPKQIDQKELNGHFAPPPPEVVERISHWREKEVENEVARRRSTSKTKTLYRRGTGGSSTSPSNKFAETSVMMPPAPPPDLPPRKGPSQEQDEEEDSAPSSSVAIGHLNYPIPSVPASPTHKEHL